MYASNRDGEYVAGARVNVVHSGPSRISRLSQSSRGVYTGDLARLNVFISRASIRSVAPDGENVIADAGKTCPGEDQQRPH